MEKSALEQEIDSLRREVERLRHEQPETKIKPETTEHPTLTINKDAKEALTEFLTHVKKDYENLSPATTLCIFALGALFGRVLTRGKGDR